MFSYKASSVSTINNAEQAKTLWLGKIQPTLDVIFPDTDGCPRSIRKLGVDVCSSLPYAHTMGFEADSKDEADKYLRAALTSAGRIKQEISEFEKKYSDESVYNGISAVLAHIPELTRCIDAEEYAITAKLTPSPRHTLG